MASTLPNAEDCCTPCDRCDDVTVVTGLTSTAPGVFFLDTVVELKAAGFAATNDRAFLAGLAAVGDGLGGMFYWDAASVLVADDVNTVNPTGNPGAGRWIRFSDI